MFAIPSEASDDLPTLLARCEAAADGAIVGYVCERNNRSGPLLTLDEMTSTLNAPTLADDT